MRTVLKWVGILLGGVLVLAFVALVLLYLMTQSRINKVYSVQVESIPITTELISEDHQYPLIMIEFCRECHGPNLAGQIMEDTPLVGRLVAPNLTAGRGGVGARFSDEDWARALRHGLDEDNKSLIVMPSNMFSQLNDRDLGYVIGVVKNAFPVDQEMPETRLGPMGRFFLLQEPHILTATLIDHSASRPGDVSPGVTLEYGEYLALVCMECHGLDYSGGDQVGAGLNLTPGGDLGHWTEEDFINVMRTGITPEGEKLNQEDMPTRITGKFSDTELKAIWLYLQSLPPVETHESAES